MAMRLAPFALAALAVLLALPPVCLAARTLCPTRPGQTFRDHVLFYIDGDYAYTSDPETTASGASCEAYCRSPEALELNGGRPYWFSQLWEEGWGGGFCSCSAASCKHMAYEELPPENVLSRAYTGAPRQGRPGGEGDPHFVGFRGVPFDFNGELGTSYCVLSDQALHLNALIKGYVHHPGPRERLRRTAQESKFVRSWMKELGLVWSSPGGGQHTLHLVARPGASAQRAAGFLQLVRVDGLELPVPGHRGASAELQSGELRLRYLGTFVRHKQEMDVYSLRIGNTTQLTLRVGPAEHHYQRRDDAQVHFDIFVRELKASPGIHGVLGQTFRSSPEQLAKAAKFRTLTKLLRGPIVADGPSGEGFLDGRVEDYASSSVLALDCRMSAFAQLGGRSLGM